MRARAAALALTLLIFPLLAPGEARAGTVCSNTPAAGQRVSCTEGRRSRATININLMNPSITTTGTYHDGVFAQHSGNPLDRTDPLDPATAGTTTTPTGDINIDVTGGSLTTSGQQAFGVLGTLRLGGGDVNINLQNVDITTTGDRANGVRGRMYNLGDINITVTGGFITTATRQAYAVIGFHEGNGDNTQVGTETSAVNIVVKNAAIKTSGAAAWGVVGYARPVNRGKIPVSVNVEGGSVETAGEAAHAVFGRLRDTGSIDYARGDVGIVVKNAAVSAAGDAAHAVLGAYESEGPQGMSDISVSVQGGSLTAEGLSASGGVGINTGLGSVAITTDAKAAVKAPFAIGAEGRLTFDQNEAGRVVIENGASVEAGGIGLLARAARASGSTFGAGTQTADDAARTEPMIHVTSSGDITVGQSATDAFIQERIAGDGTLSSAERAVLSAVTAGNSAALTTALAALSASYDEDWKDAARDLLRKRGFAPTEAAALANRAAVEILDLPRAGIRALALDHTAIATHVRQGDRDATILALAEADRTTQQEETLAQQEFLSAAERRVLEAVLTGGDLAGALAALPAAYTDDWKDEVRRLALSYNEGDIRVDVDGGTIASEGDGVHARYVLDHERNGAITVNVAEGAEITGERAGVFVSGAGLGDLARDDPLGAALGLTADEADLHQQFVTVHGTVTGGTDAGIHLAGGGTLLVGETGEILAGSSGRAVWVNHPGRAVVVVHGTVRGGAGAPAAIHLTGGGSVTVGLNGRVEANGATAAIRGDAETTIVVHAEGADPESLRAVGERFRGAIGGEGAPASVTIVLVNPDTGMTTGEMAPPLPVGADGMLELPPEPMEPEEPPAPPAGPRFDCGMAADRRCELYEALPSLLLAVSRPPSFGERATVSRGADGVWGRVEAARGEWTADRADSVSRGEKLDYDFNMAGGRAGVDFTGARGRFGFSFHALRAKAEISGAGEIVVNAVGAGASAAWTPGSFYAEASAQVSRLDADIDSAAPLVGGLKKDAGGAGAALGVEIGSRRALLDGALAFTPRLGFVWARAELDDFTDSVGSRVSVERARSARARAGFTLEAKAREEGGRLFASADLERELSRETRARIEDARLEARESAATALRLGAGGAFEVGEGWTLVFSGHETIGSGARRYGAAVSLGMRF